MSFFRKDTTICLIQKNEAENIDKFNERGNFVVKQKPQNDREYNKTVLYSNIYINTKYLKCKYSDGITKELEKMKENL
mgnify:CR=1 FL=1